MAEVETPSANAADMLRSKGHLQANLFARCMARTGPSDWMAGNAIREEYPMRNIVLALFIAASAVPVAAEPAPSGAAAAGKLSADTSIETIAASPAGRTVLDAQLPSLTAHPMYEAFKAMSLRQLQPISNGAISAEALEKVDAALKALP